MQAATANMKSHGYHMMSVGFGPQRFVQRFRPELEAISTNMKKDVFLQGFNEAEEIANRIVEASLLKGKVYATKPAICSILKATYY